MKKIIIRIGIVVVALGIIALVAVFLSLNTIVKKGVEKVGPMMTKVEVTLGSAAISPFSGSGKLSKLFVGNPEGYKSPSAINIEDIKVGVGLGSLMSDTIVVNELNLQGAEITLEGSLTANNLTKILDNLNAPGTDEPKPKGAPPAPGASKSSKKFIVKDLVIEGAKVNLDLTLLGSKTVTIPIPPLHLENIGTAENGVTAEELVKAIMKPLIADILTAATQEMGNISGQLKNLGKGGADSVDKATKGITDLFKKK